MTLAVIITIYDRINNYFYVKMWKGVCKIGIMKNSIIFDLDGTLWEVIESTYKSANEIAYKHGLKEISKDTICKVFGLNKEGAAKLYFPYLELSESTKLIDEIAVINIENLMSSGGNVYPNVTEVLDNLVDKYDLYIVSNTAETNYIKAFLKAADSERVFKDYIAASSLNISKADAIKKVIGDNNIKKAVYVGDTVIDFEVANENNIPFVQAKYGFGEDLNTDFAINEIKELPSVLENVFYK